MLKALKNTELSAVPPTHVDLFVEHYDQLRRWALQFSEHDPGRSEDLLHNFFSISRLPAPISVYRKSRRLRPGPYFLEFD